MDITQMKQMAEAELKHIDRLQLSVEAWQAYEVQLRTAVTNLQNAALHTTAGWQDDAGTLFAARTDASAASITAKLSAVADQKMADVLRLLMNAIQTTYNTVLAAYQDYQAALGTPNGADIMTAALQEAALALQQLGEAYDTTAQTVTAASGPGIEWNGPGSGADAPGGAPASTDAAPPGGPAGDGPASGTPAATGADAAGADAGGAASAGAPPSGGATPSPSLAGITPSAPSTTLPPIKPVIPASHPVPTLPHLTPAGLTPVRPTGGRGSVGVPRVGLPPTASTPKVSTVSGTAVPTVGQAPQPPATGARPTGGTSGATGVPPMGHPMGHGAARTGRTPKAGDAETKPARKAKPPRTVPGVPESLRGRAGKLDAKQAFLFPAGRPAGREDESGTGQLIDEDLWEIDGADQARITWPRKG